MNNILGYFIFSISGPFGEKLPNLVTLAVKFILLSIRLKDLSASEAFKSPIKKG
jgi:hypothetical protein